MGSGREGAEAVALARMGRGSVKEGRVKAATVPVFQISHTEISVQRADADEVRPMTGGVRFGSLWFLTN